VEDPRISIANLLYLYAERIDRGDFEGVADLFADAEITADGTDVTTRGRDAVLAMYRSTTRLHGNSTPRTQHVVTNPVIEVDEGAGRARSRSQFTVLQSVPGELALQPVIAGRYHDTFIREGIRWRFASRHMIVDLVGDLSQHLLFDLPEA